MINGNKLAPPLASRWLALITFAWGALVLWYAVMFPVFQAPDEYVHADLVFFHEEQGLDTIDNRGRFVSNGMRDIAAGGPNAFVQFPRVRSLAPPYGERPTFSELNIFGPLSAEVNYGQQTSSAYYYGMAFGDRAIRAAWPGNDLPFDAHVLLLRLISAAWVIPLPVLVSFCARELGAARIGQATAALVPFAIPQLLHISGAISTDDPALLFAAVATLGALKMTNGDLRSRTVLAAAVALGLCVFIKATGMALVPVSLATLVIGVRRTGVDWRRPLGLWGAASFLAGGWFYARNLVEYRSILRPVEPGRYATAVGFEPDQGYFFRHFFLTLGESYTGWFSYLTVRLPQYSYLIPIVLILFGVAWSFYSKPARTLLAVAPLVIGMALMYALTYQGYVDAGFPSGMQGRYLYVISIGAWAAAGYGMEQMGVRLGRPLIGFALTVVTAFVLNILAFARVADRYAVGDSFPEDLATLAVWSPLSARMTFLLFAVAVASGVLMVVGLFTMLAELTPTRNGPKPGVSPPAGEHTRPITTSGR